MTTTDAVAAAQAVTSGLGLAVDEVVVLQESNRVTVRLLPCDVLARVSPVEAQVAAFEVAVARQLTLAGSPVAGLEPRVEPVVHERDGYVVTLWSYYEPLRTDIAPVDYAGALRKLHAGMRDLDIPTPHFTDRIGHARQLLADRDRTPDLADADRELLVSTLRRPVGGRGSAEQVLHGEPHPGNVLATSRGPLFIDLETCCRGPVEFDLAHAPEDVAAHYPGVDHDLLRDCRLLMLAMITTWRWDRADRLPEGRRLAAEWLDQIRAVTPPRPG